MISKDGEVRYASLVIASVAILAVPALSNLIVNAVLGGISGGWGFLIGQWSQEQHCRLAGTVSPATFLFRSYDSYASHPWRAAQ